MVRACDARRALELADSAARSELERTLFLGALLRLANEQLSFLQVHHGSQALASLELRLSSWRSAKHERLDVRARPRLAEQRSLRVKLVRAEEGRSPSPTANLALQPRETGRLGAGGRADVQIPVCEVNPAHETIAVQVKHARKPREGRHRLFGFSDRTRLRRRRARALRVGRAIARFRVAFTLRRALTLDRRGSVAVLRRVSVLCRSFSRGAIRNRGDRVAVLRCDWPPNRRLDRSAILNRRGRFVALGRRHRFVALGCLGCDGALGRLCGISKFGRVGLAAGRGRR